MSENEPTNPVRLASITGMAWVFHGLIGILWSLISKPKVPKGGIEMESKMGVVELKQLLDLALAGVSVGVSASKDGKIGVEDMGYLMALIPVIGPAIDGIDMIPAELADLDEAEAAEVIAHVMGKLVIDNAKAVAVIGKSLKAIAAVYDLVKAVKAEAPVAA